jgi:hypothetical protein
MSRSPSLADFTDLSPADRQIAAALIETRRERLLADLTGLIAATDPQTQALAKGLVDAMATLSAEISLVRESVEQAHRTHAQRVRIDPLPLIPESGPAERPARFELHAASSAFDGMGWYPAERQGDLSWRWSGLAPTACLLLPSLGGGPLSARLELLMPFSQPFPTAPLAIQVNGAPVPLAAAGAEGQTTAFQAEFTLPEDEGFGHFTLAFPQLHVTDPAPPGRRDGRVLGIGIRRLILESRATP